MLCGIDEGEDDDDAQFFGLGRDPGQGGIGPR